MKKLLYCILIVISLHFLVACGHKVVPVAIQGAEIDEKMAQISLLKEGIRLTAEAAYLYDTPYSLEDYFTPFRLVVRNETGHEINISLDDFMLIDDRGNQLRAYSPEEMTTIIKSDPDYVMSPPVVAIPVPGFRVYSGPQTGLARPAYESFPNEGPYYDENIGNWVYPPLYQSKERRKFSDQTLMQDIYLTAIPVGKIVPGAQVSGNVYFRADMRMVESVKVRAIVNNVVFELPFTVK